MIAYIADPNTGSCSVWWCYRV